MSESYTHNPANQTISQAPSQTHFMAGEHGLIPMPEYLGIDSPTNTLYGPFLTRGACEFVLGCIAQVRESQERRNMYRPMSA